MRSTRLVATRLVATRLAAPRLAAPRLAATLGVFALGTALSALPALAQEYHTGRAANDGGPLAAQEQKQAQNQDQTTGSRSTASAQNNAQPAQQSSRDNIRAQQAMDANTNASGERSRPRVTHRMTTIRMREAARNQTAARSEDTETLRAAAGPSNVAETTAPPQRQTFGYNGPTGGTGERYYDRYSDNAGGGFAPNAGLRPTAMDRNDIAACQMRYRSYDPQSGTFMGFDGMPHPCP